MINPQMMGMGALPDLPTQAELWKDERSKYRPFIIMFAVGIIAVLTLLIVSFALNASGLSEIKDKIRPDFLKWWIADNGASAVPDMNHINDQVDKWVNWYIYGYPIASFVLLGIGVFLYFGSVYNSYSTKTFAKLSGYATLIVFVGAMFSVFQLMQMAWSEQAQLVVSFPGGVFQVVAYSLVIALAILGSQISKIKRTFFASARVEALKNDPAYQAAQAQMNAMMNGQMPQGGTMGPFGPVVPQAPVGPQAGAAAVNPAAPQAPVISKEQEKLEKMSLANLKKVAEKLSISGADKMEKKELITAILRVTDNK